MSRLAQWSAGVAMAVACAAAGAQMHQICYEAPQLLANHDGIGALDWTPTAIYACTNDMPSGRCTITSESTQLVPRNTGAPVDAAVTNLPGTTVRYFDVSTPAMQLPSSHRVRFDFFDGNNVNVGTRFCTVTARLTYGGELWSHSPGAVLTGFSTDSSGLASTGVWRLPSGTNTPNNRLEIFAPGDFVAVGGGAMGVNSPNGALVAGSLRWPSLPASDRKWAVRTSEVGGAPQPHQATAFIVGLKIEGLPASTLRQVLQMTTLTSHPNVTNHPGLTVMPGPSTNVVISGGFDAYAAQAEPVAGLFGQSGTMSAPQTGQVLLCGSNGLCRLGWGIAGWRAESKDHVLARPGWMNTQLITLPRTVTVNGTAFEVQARLVSATSAQASHPSVNATGLRGTHALTGIGATVNWREGQPAIGNLLWKLEPRADIGGATAASKDHILFSPSTITAHAIGIRLVPPVPCLGC